VSHDLLVPFVLEYMVVLQQQQLWLSLLVFWLFPVIFLSEPFARPL
jgi:hypothetical protein